MRPFTGVASVLLVTGLTACRGRPQIVGEVKDNFGVGVPGAAVSVTGTTFAATAGPDGRYAVEYVPGSIKLEVRKDGYVPGLLVLNVVTETRVPASPIVLYKKPPAGRGVYYVGARDYVPLTKVKLVVRNMDLDSRGWGQSAAVAYYQIESITDKFLAHLPCADAGRAVFVDSQAASLRLFQVPWDGYTVLAREYSTTASRDTATIIGEGEPLRPDGFVVRSAKLECGVLYAFVGKGAGAAFCDIGCGGMPFGSPIGEPVYAFEFR